MNQQESKQVNITLPDSMYTQLLDLIDARIRSERARAREFEWRCDHSNEMIALGNKSRLINLRNTIVESCSEVDDV